MTFFFWTQELERLAASNNDPCAPGRCKTLPFPFFSFSWNLRLIKWIGRAVLSSSESFPNLGDLGSWSSGISASGSYRAQFSDNSGNEKSYAQGPEITILNTYTYKYTYKFKYTYKYKTQTNTHTHTTIQIHIQKPQHGLAPGSITGLQSTNNWNASKSPRPLHLINLIGRPCFWPAICWPLWSLRFRSCFRWCLCLSLTPKPSTCWFFCRCRWRWSLRLRSCKRPYFNTVNTHRWRCRWSLPACKRRFNTSCASRRWRSRLNLR